MKDIKPGRAGVRALLLGKDGDTRDDFRIEYGEIIVFMFLTHHLQPATSYGYW